MMAQAWRRESAASDSGAPASEWGFALAALALIVATRRSLRADAHRSSAKS
jgi:MYXO-CTERM domain-containing protein